MDISFPTLYRAQIAETVGNRHLGCVYMCGFLGKKVTDQLRVRRNLRNQLVHSYNSYTVAELYEQAKDTSDIDSFKVSVRKLLR